MRQPAPLTAGVVSLRTCRSNEAKTKISGPLNQVASTFREKGARRADGTKQRVQTENELRHMRDGRYNGNRGSPRWQQLERSLRPVRGMSTVRQRPGILMFACACITSDTLRARKVAPS